MTAKKTPESSVTNDIIHKVHLTLADLRTGEDIIGFLRETEPVFMSEVSRFIHTEVGRLRYHLSESHAMYIGSIIGAAYIAGFLIAREAAHKMFNGHFSFDSTIDKAITTEEVDKLIDKYTSEGKTYKEIGKCLRKFYNLNNKRKVIKPKKSKGKRLKIDGLDE